MSPEARARGARHSQCTGKRRYRDRDEAKTVRAACVRARPNQPLRIYDCPHCRGFHLTAQDAS